METACNYVLFDEVFSLKWKNLETSHVRKVEKCKELSQGYFPLFFWFLYYCCIYSWL